jgi:hypothetical protein
LLRVKMHQTKTMVSSPPYSQATAPLW